MNGLKNAERITTIITMASQGATLTDTAKKLGIARETLSRWIARNMPTWKATK